MINKEIIVNNKKKKIFGGKIMKKLILTDNGITSSKGIMTAEQALMIGKLSEFKKMNIENIVIGVRSEGLSSVLSSAFSAGASENGINVFYIGEACLPELLYCSDIIDENCLAVYIRSVFEPYFTFYINRKPVEIDIIRADNEISEKQGVNIDFSKLKMLYSMNLKKKCAGIENMNVKINSPSERIRNICSDIFRDYSKETEITFHIDEKAEKVTAFTDTDGYISCEKLLAVVLNEGIKNNEESDIMIPVDFPGIAEKIAYKNGKNIIRSNKCRMDFFTDKILLIVEILKIIQKYQCDIKELLRQIPDYAELERYLPIDSEKALNYLYKEYDLNNNQDSIKGITLANELGKISVKPVRSGKGIILFAESYAMEAASELCNFYENKLNTFVKNSKNIKNTV